MFIQLTHTDCQYLLNLIDEMDSETAYTKSQRGYTFPKLVKIQKDPRSARLAYQDVDYLLELIEDDDLEELEQQREMTRQAMLEIQVLQNQKFEERGKLLVDIETQRQLRKARRGSVQPLQAHFEHTEA